MVARAPAIGPIKTQSYIGEGPWALAMLAQLGVIIAGFIQSSVIKLMTLLKLSVLQNKTKGHKHGK